MKTYPNQTNFSQGELSPLMGGRTDLEIYAAGVETMLNMYADSRGPSISREGIKRVLELSGTNARVETLPRTSSTFFTIILLDLQLILIRNIFNPVQEVFVSPWTEDQIDDVQIVPLPDGSDIYFLHPNVQPYKLTDNTAEGNSQEFLSSGTFNVPSTGVNDIAYCMCGGGGSGGNSSTANGSPGGGGGGGSGVVKGIVSVVPSEVLTITIGAGGPAVTTAAGSDGGDTTLVVPSVGTITAAGGKTGSIALAGNGSEGGGNGGASGGFKGDSCSAVCGSESFSGGSGSGGIGNPGGGGGAGGYGEGGSGLSGSAAPNSGGGGAGARGPDDEGMGLDSGGAGGSGRCVLTWEISTGVFILTPVSFTAPPANWTGTNWPSAGTYYQGRLWLGGAPDQKETFLGSKSNDPENFTIGTLADDALNHSIERFGQIEWMESTKNLIIGTGNAEYIVTAESGLIKPGDIEVNQQSEYGSASIQPAKIGDQVVYVSPDARKIRAINYNRDNDNWLSKDLTFPSEHITKGLIKDLTWCQNPNNFLWATLKDGTLCCMTYERSYDIIGFHRHSTYGKVLSTTSGFDGIRNVLILATERTDGNIEIGYFNFDYKLDSWAESFTVTESGGLYYVEGFDHLEGMTVQILADGSVHPDRVVGAESSIGAGDGSTGRIYLTKSFNKITAGLQFISELELLPVDGGSPAGSGVSHIKRRNEIGINLLESGIPLVNGDRGDDRSPSTPMGTPEPLVTGIREYTGLGWDKKATVSIKQDLPLPLKVLSVHGSIAKNKL